METINAANTFFPAIFLQPLVSVYYNLLKLNIFSPIYTNPKKTKQNQSN